MQERNFQREFIAPCGMNCGICIAFFGYTMKGYRRKKPCNTCRSRKNQCAFIQKECDKVATEQIEYCFECTDFPCANLRTLDKRYRDKYSMSMIENLRYIQANGIEQFLKNEQERWRCPNCGGTICVQNGTCYECGQISILKGYEKT